MFSNTYVATLASGNLLQTSGRSTSLKEKRNLISEREKKEEAKKKRET